MVEDASEMLEKLTPAVVQKAAFGSPEQKLFSRLRAYIEKTALTAPRHAEKVMLPNGGEVRVLWSLVDLDHGDLFGDGNLQPIRPIKKDAALPLVVSVMNTGMFEAAVGYRELTSHTGNAEAKLAAGLFAESTGELAPNAIIMFKPEGMNTAAYVQGQTLVGRASAETLKRIIDEYKETHHVPVDKPVVFDLTGYSEGSTQILSVAAEIMRRKIGKVKRVVSLSGSGFVGAPPGGKVSPILAMVDAMLERVKTRLNPRKPGVYAKRLAPIPDIHLKSEVIKHVSSRLTKYPENYEFLHIQKKGVGPDLIEKSRDLQNLVGFFGNRLLKTMLGRSELGASVPWRRLEEVFKVNPDIEYVLVGSENQTPPEVMVLADLDDAFFPGRKIHATVENLRQKYPDAKLWFVSTSFGHSGPHFEQTATSWLIRTLLNAWEKRLAKS